MADKETAFNEQWGWFVTLDMLSNNNPYLWDAIGDWHAIKFFNMISYYHAKAKVYGGV